MTRRSKATPDDVLPDGEPTSIVRRAPFADSPFVGERGQKAQLRILEAALEVFGDVGYHGCGVKRITELSGYSRASFYQYFSSKEDLFRHLAGRVARELIDAAAQLEPITGDLAGWQSFHRWLTRYAEIYDTYEPVFVTFQTAAASDQMVASGATVVAERSFRDLRAKIEGSPLPSREVDSIVNTLFETVSRLNRESEILELVSRLDRTRANLAFADAFHRALFGPDPDVNVHTPKQAKRRAPRPAATVVRELEGDVNHGPAAQRTRSQLLDAGHEVFVAQGFYATRVADVVEAAGVSHGVFYRYFDNKAHLFRILAERASLQLAEALDSLPEPFTDGDPAAAGELRDWLRRYADTYASEAAIFIMWQEAMSRDPELGKVAAAVLDGSRLHVARYLEARDFGDVDADALVLLVLVDGMTSHRPTPARIEATAEMIERGLLTAPPAKAKTRTSRSA